MASYPPNARSGVGRANRELHHEGEILPKAADQALTDHARSRWTDGAPRVHAELRLALDARVGRKR